MKNRLADLTTHLFAQVERLGDEALSADQLKVEIDRSKALADVSGRILDAGRLGLDAAKLAHAARVEQTNVPLPALFDRPAEALPPPPGAPATASAATPPSNTSRGRA